MEISNSPERFRLHFVISTVDIYFNEPDWERLVKVISHKNWPSLRSTLLKIDGVIDVSTMSGGTIRLVVRGTESNMPDATRLEIQQTIHEYLENATGAE